MPSYDFRLTHPARPGTGITIRMTPQELSSNIIVRWEEIPDPGIRPRLTLSNGWVYWTPATGLWRLCERDAASHVIATLDAPSHIGLDDMTPAYHGPVPGAIQLNATAGLPSTGWVWRFV